MHIAVQCYPGLYLWQVFNTYPMRDSFFVLLLVDGSVNPVNSSFTSSPAGISFTFLIKYDMI